MTSLYQEARAALRESAFKPRRRFGQHFLIQEGIIEGILRLVELSPEDEVVEIGPGLGFLTRRLVEMARRVWAVEVDPSLVGWLRAGPLGSHPGFELIHGDFLKVQLNTILPGHKVKLVANLPYNLSTPILFRLFEFRESFSLLVLMVQREVAERMAATPGTKAYGTLSIWCQIYGQILDKVSVSPEAFFPRPKVKSTVLKIGLYPRPLVSAEDILLFRALVRVAFGQRRKTLSNALARLLNEGREATDRILQQEGIDPRRRGETLTVDEFIRLARGLKTAISGGS
jgi:16S rRNA (adenine1518-N6/adenine1519-N6)-dimethyltransferase